MFTTHNPDAVAGPHGEYSHGVDVPAGAGWLSLAGQVGTRADGSVPEDVGEQCEWVFRNIFAILKAAGMGPENLVTMTSYLTSQDYWPAYREAKARMIGAVRPTSTLVVIPALALPEWKVEITAWAARPA
jgi:enamine deaminase RidA (YjgF/YER057c/UK114 family)